MACNSANNDRVVALVDMDCFYVQVEERDNPSIKGRPAAVVQYNTHRGGGIIAVNYEARACGVKRGMRGTDASELCPGISLVRVPMLRNKANLQKYRNAGKEVLTVLCGYSDVVERASIDEAYLDLTRVVDDKIEQWRRHKASGTAGDTCNGSGGVGVQDAGSASDIGNGVGNEDAGLEHGAGEIDKNQAPSPSVIAQNGIEEAGLAALNDSGEPGETRSDQAGSIGTLNNRDDGRGLHITEEGSQSPERAGGMPKPISCDTTVEKAEFPAGNIPVQIETKPLFHSSVEALIPTLKELKSTWVKLPDDKIHQELQTEYDLADKDDRNKYELDETFLSQWTPRNAGEEEKKKLIQNEQEEKGELDQGEDEQKAETDTSNDQTKPDADADKEAERLKDLTKWMNCIHEEYERHSSSLDDDGESSSSISCAAAAPDPNASVLLMSSRRGSGSRRVSVAGPSLADLRLAVAARLCEEMREAVFRETGFRCSAGIAHNKVLAKLVCGLHKPNQQTVIPSGSVGALWEDTAVHKVRNLGGKLGESLVTDFGCKTMAELSRLSLAQLQGRFDDKTALWLYGLGRGHDSEAVVSRQLAKSVGCSKNFLGRESLYTRAKVEEWTRALSEELAERLQEDMDTNKRVSRSLTVGVRQGQPQGGGASSYGTRCCPLLSYAPDRITSAVLTVLEVGNTAKQRDLWSPPILNISLSASKFEDSLTTGMPSISDMFKRVVQKQATQASAAGEGCSREREAGTSRVALSDSMVMGGSVRAGETMDGACNGSDSSSTRSRLDSGATHRHEGGILAYLTEEQSRRETSNVTTVLEDSDPDDPGEINQKKIEKDTSPGNSFFKKFLMRKRSSANEQGPHSESIRNSNLKGSSVSYEDDDSCDAAINLLVDQLDADSDDEGSSFKRDLELNPISKNRPNSSVCEAETTPQEVYEVSTDSDEDSSRPLPGASKTTNSLKVSNSNHNAEPCDEDHEYESNQKTVSDKERKSEDCPRLLTTSTSAPPVSVSELFPDLDSVDESLLSLLPADLRRAVAQALVKHKADQAGKEALRKTGIWRYMNKQDSNRGSDSERGREDLKMNEGRVKANLSISSSSHESKPKSRDVNNSKSESSSSKGGGIEKYMTQQVRDERAEGKSPFTENSHKNASCSRTKDSIKQPGVDIIHAGCSINIAKFSRVDGNCSETSTSIHQTDDSEASTFNKQTDKRNNHEEDVNVGTSNGTNTPQETIDCDRCGAPVPLTDIEEHLDYHVALDLQKQFEGGVSAVTPSRGSIAGGASDRSALGTSKNSTQAKPGKRKLSSKTTTPEAKKNRTLDTFFKK